MGVLQFVGALDILTNEIVDLITKDSVLQDWPILKSESLININPEDDDSIPATNPPFTSVHLSDKVQVKGMGSTGGERVRFNVQGRVITFIPPEGDQDMPSLNNLGERFDKIFREHDLSDSFESISAYNFHKSFLRPYMMINEGYRKKMADTVTTEFDLDYEVSIVDLR